MAEYNQLHARVKVLAPLAAWLDEDRDEVDEPAVSPALAEAEGKFLRAYNAFLEPSYLVAGRVATGKAPPAEMLFSLNRMLDEMMAAFDELTTAMRVELDQIRPLFKGLRAAAARTCSGHAIA